LLVALERLEGRALEAQVLVVEVLVVEVLVVEVLVVVVVVVVLFGEFLPLLLLEFDSSSPLLPPASG
jgi:hypothetical protein